MYCLKNYGRNYMMYCVENYILFEKLLELHCNIYDILFKKVYCEMYDVLGRKLYCIINYIYSYYCNLENYWNYIIVLFSSNCSIKLK